MVYIINLNVRRGRAKHKLHTTSNDELRVLHTLLLGVIILKLCYKNQHKEEREGEGYNTLAHTRHEIAVSKNMTT